MKKINILVIGKTIVFPQKVIKNNSFKIDYVDPSKATLDTFGEKNYEVIIFDFTEPEVSMKKLRLFSDFLDADKAKEIKVYTLLSKQTSDIIKRKIIRCMKPEGSIFIPLPKTNEALRLILSKAENAQNEKSLQAELINMAKPSTKRILYREE
jgi:hypothetical protein